MKNRGYIILAMAASTVIANAIIYLIPESKPFEIGKCYQSKFGKVITVYDISNGYLYYNTLGDNDGNHLMRVSGITNINDTMYIEAPCEVGNVK